MDKTQDRGQFDWLAEVAGAVAPASAAAFAAMKLAPLNGWSIPVSVMVAGVGVFATAWLAIRVIPSEGCRFALPAFDHIELEEELLLDQPAALGELLLDQPLVADQLAAVAELVLDDPLPLAAPDSRVVQLFADGRMPSAGQLLTRIDRHLVENAKSTPAADASDALGEALAELRRSLRQA